MYVDTVFGFYGYFYFFNGLVGCLSMIVWAPAILGVLYACVLHFCMCTCSVQLSMFHIERHSRNRLIITNIIILLLIIIVKHVIDQIRFPTLLSNGFDSGVNNDYFCSMRLSPSDTCACHQATGNHFSAACECIGVSNLHVISSIYLQTVHTPFSLFPSFFQLKFVSS